MCVHDEREHVLRGKTTILGPLIAAALVMTSGLTGGTPAGAASDTPGTWMSGAAGDGVATGELGTWRGSPVTIAGTWADDNDAMTNLWQLQPGNEFGSWDGALEIAIGGLDDGETWQEAADGAYDERWRESLTALRDLWGARTSTVYVRLAHEMNGTWYDWSVNEGNQVAFVEGWKRFRALQQEIFPASKLVFSPNRQTTNGLDWRAYFPGAQFVDVLSTNYYNQAPYVGTQAEWDAALTAVDGAGAPQGLQAFADYARSVGLPLGISEWSGNADLGDSSVFVENLHRFLVANGGSGPGQVLYEVQFNEVRDGNKWLLFGDTRMPASAEVYRTLW